MKKTKKILLLLLALVLTVFVTGCGSGSKNSSSSSTRRNSSSKATEAADQQTSEEAAAEQAQELLAEGKEYEEAALKAAADAWKDWAVPDEEEELLAALGFSPEQYVREEQDFISRIIGLPYLRECLIPAGQLDSSLLKQAEEDYREADELFSTAGSLAAIERITAMRQWGRADSAQLSVGDETAKLTYQHDENGRLTLLRMTIDDQKIEVSWTYSAQEETFSMRSLGRDWSEDILSRSLTKYQDGRIEHISWSETPWDISDIWWTYDADGLVKTIQCNMNYNTGEPYRYELNWQDGKLIGVSELGSDGSAMRTIDVIRETADGKDLIDLVADGQSLWDEAGVYCLESTHVGDQLTSLIRFDGLLACLDDCTYVKTDYSYSADGSLSRTNQSVYDGWEYDSIDWNGLDSDRLGTDYDRYGRILTRQWDVERGEFSFKGTWTYDENGLLQGIDLPLDGSEIQFTFHYDSDSDSKVPDPSAEPTAIPSASTNPAAPASGIVLDRDRFIAAVEACGNVYKGNEPDSAYQESFQMTEQLDYEEPSATPKYRRYHFLTFETEEGSEAFYDMVVRFCEQNTDSFESKNGDDYRFLTSYDSYYGQDQYTFLIQQGRYCLFAETEQMPDLKDFMKALDYPLSLDDGGEYLTKIDDAVFDAAVQKAGYEFEDFYTNETLALPGGEYDVKSALNYYRGGSGASGFFAHYIVMPDAASAWNLFWSEYTYQNSFYPNVGMGFRNGGNFHSTRLEEGYGLILQIDNLVLYISGESDEQITAIMKDMGLENFD